MRTYRCLAAAIATLVIAGCDGGVDKTRHANLYQYESMIPDTLRRMFARGNEARDEQEIVDIVQAGGGGGPTLTVGATRTTKSTVVPNTEIDGWAQSVYEQGWKLVAAVTLADGDVPTLRLSRGMNGVYLHYDAASQLWQARIDNDPAKALHVTRYTYSNLTITDIPVTARWDWEGPADQAKLVFGVKCADGWCLIGTAQSAKSGDDPADSDPSRPVYRRVRGYYDRKINTANAGYVSLYPGASTGSVNDDDELKDKWHHYLTIQVDGLTDEIPIDLKHENLGRGLKFRKASGGNKVDVYKVAAEAMPAAARWSKSHIDLPIQGGGLTAILVREEFGEAWVRCASGCCSADLIF